MRFLYSFFTSGAVFSAAVSGRYIDGRDPTPPGDVGACKAVIIAMRASAFCSSFVPISDVTSTATQTGTAVSTQVTVTAPCTNPFKKRQLTRPGISTTPAAPSTTPAAPSTTPRAPSTTPAAPSTTPAAPSTTPRAPSTTPAAPSTTPASSSKTTTSVSPTPKKCAIKDLPRPIAVFACDIIKDACKELVKPKTVTVTTFVPGPTATGTKTVTPTCPITTTRNRQPSTTPATTT